MSFTDQQPRVATAEDCRADWSFGKDGIFFRCKLCGHRFVEGDVWRWVYMGAGYRIGGLGISNGLVCAACDGPDVQHRMVEHWREALTRFWFLFDADHLKLAEQPAPATPATEPQPKETPR